MTETFDVVVIGSGFGGAVTACRLAEAGRSVCVLERGRRWSGADFPRSAGQVANAFWEEGRSHGFLEYLAFRRVDVIQGSGVGGGSLHYFNVNLRPNRSVFDNGAWPASLRSGTVLDPFYDTALAVLGSAPLVAPEGRTSLPLRTSTFVAAARRAGYRPELVPIAVHTGPARTIDGVGMERPCTYCGNCLFGCDIGAKRSLDRNYLAMAESHGAVIRPLHVVNAVVPSADGYRVDFMALAEDPSAPAAEGSVQAPQVVVAAGSLGSTELLLRCRDELGTLPRLSAALGSRFSLNGEFLFAHTAAIDSAVDPGLGPPITARVTASSGDLTVTVQDLGVPDALLWFLEGAVPPPLARLRRLAGVVRDYLRRSRAHRPTGRAGVRLDALLSSSRTSRALPYLGMGTDSSDGTVRLQGGRLAVDWSPRHNRQLYRLHAQVMGELSKAAGGRFVTSALGRWPLRKVLTAHPLGGCPMGDDPLTSVVDDLGRVHGYPGLHVMDGAVIPSALAVNPSLTIAALAERAAAAMTIDSRPGSIPTS